MYTFQFNTNLLQDPLSNDPDSVATSLKLVWFFALIVDLKKVTVSKE